MARSMHAIKEDAPTVIISTPQMWYRSIVFIQQEKMEVQHQMAGKGALTARVRHRNKRHGLTARRKRNIQLRMRQRRGV